MQYLCKHPLFIKSVGRWVDCGHCLACRNKQKSQWVMRLGHQATLAPTKVLFLTLTYADEHLPPNRSLSIRDLQLFFKRLRKSLSKRDKIKYYACGEYGPKTARPHYHIIMYGLTPSYAPLILRAWGKCDEKHFNIQSGFDSKAFGYVAGYSAKKLGVAYNKKFYAENPGKIPEFQLQSLGLGYDWLKAQTLIQGIYLRHNGKDVIPPRYYRKKLNIDGAVYKDVIKKKELKIYETILALNPAEKGLTYDIPPANGTHYSWAGKYVTDKFYQKLQLLRDQSDLFLRQRIKDWRQKI